MMIVDSKGELFFEEQDERVGRFFTYISINIDFSNLEQIKQLLRYDLLV